MNEDRRIGQRAGIRWAIAWLREMAEAVDGPSAKVIVSALADQMANDAKKLRAEEAPEGWQDIATAPKDGTRILTWGCLHNDGGVDMGETAAVRLSFWARDGWYNENVGGHEPTKWQPMPDPPEDADDIAAGLEALKEPVVATWPEVKTRLNLGKEERG